MSLCAGQPRTQVGSGQPRQRDASRIASSHDLNAGRVGVRSPTTDLAGPGPTPCR
jgi:hypothetical protein